VRFLDYVDRRVWRVIRARERRIKLLEEYKHALVHQAVTGRIDVRTGQPFREYKDTAFPWLRKVPAHWQVRKLRYVAEMRESNVDKRIRDGERPVRLCNYLDVYKNDRIRGEQRFMRATASVDEIERFGLQKGDVLITKDSEAWHDIGVPALVESATRDLVSGYHLALLRPLTRCIDGPYLFRALQDPTVAYQFHVEAKGVTRYGLSHHAINSVKLPVPPLAEQTAIAEFLDEQTASIDRVADATRREIGLLKEFRTRLIADVVTGKLDVRAATARLPEKAPEDEEETLDEEETTGDDNVIGETWLGAIPEEGEG